MEADVPPSGKADVIKRLQAEGNRVAMAGDGINDARAGAHFVQRDHLDRSIVITWIAHELSHVWDFAFDKAATEGDDDSVSEDRAREYQAEYEVQCR